MINLLLAGERLLEMQNLPRVPLPPDVADDDHNRIGGLVKMIGEFFPPSAHVIELGTGRGVSTEVFALLCERVHTTDIYAPGTEEWKAAFCEMEKRYTNILQYYQDCNELAARFPQASVDAVYIDEVHDYESVKADIMTWLPKIKVGGTICGHDYIERPEYNFGVIRAVCEIFGAPDKVFADTSWAVRVE